MSLHEIQVHHNWHERQQWARRDAQLALRAVLLIALLSSGVLAWWHRLSPRGNTPLLLISLLYLLVGVGLFKGTVIGHRRPLAVGGVLVAGSALSSVLTDVPTTVAVGSLILFPPLIAAGASAAGAWALFVWGVWARHRRPPSRGALLSAAGWTLIGITAGSGAVLLWYLSARFSALVPPLGESSWTSNRLFWQEALVATGVQSVAEEATFRGVLFHVLYHRQHVGFWRATAMTWAANGALYAVQMAWLPGPPDETLLFFLGPSVLILVNCALYAVEGNIVSALSSNVGFRALALAIGLLGRGT